MIGHSLQEADLSLHAANFLSKNYLLIHGTADTLVHQQHTMLLTKSLIQKGVIFRHQVRFGLDQKFYPRVESEQKLGRIMIMLWMMICMRKRDKT